MNITLAHMPFTRSSNVVWALEEAGASYSVKLLNRDKNEHKSPEHLKLHPLGKVPVLIVDGVSFTETPAIIAWIADAFPAAGLAPAIDSTARGPYLQWLLGGATMLEPMIFDLYNDRTPDSRMTGYGTAVELLSYIDGLLAEREWITGDRFTAADITIGGNLRWALGWKLLQKVDVSIDNIRAYIGRLSSRPASQISAAKDKAWKEALGQAGSVPR